MGVRTRFALRDVKAATSLRCVARTYSRPKVIHKRRGVTSVHSPQPLVHNFGGVKFFFGEQLGFWLNREVGRAGFGRRMTHSNVVTFFWRCSLRALRPAVKEYSEPFARKRFFSGRDELYKSFHPAGPRAWLETQKAK